MPEEITESQPESPAVPVTPEFAPLGSFPLPIESERYQILGEPLGRGGFGQVYPAHDRLFDKPVAIKVLIGAHLRGLHEPQFRRQFFREAVAGARLGQKTPHIVKVLDYGYDRTSDKPFFVMEHISGTDLSRRIGKLYWPEAIKLFDHLLQALGVAHGAGVLHSDISPDNILWDEIDETFKLSDFGLAKLLNSTLLSRGALPTIIGGKAGYLPLDDWQTGERTFHSDLYGLAVSVVHLLTSQMPRWRSQDGIFKPPKLEELFETSELKTGKVVGGVSFDTNAGSQFLIEFPEEGGWHFLADGKRHGFEISRMALVQILEAIVRGRLQDTRAVIKEVREKTREHLLGRLTEERKKASRGK